MPTSSSAYRGQNTASTHLKWDVFVTPSIPVVTTDFAPGEHERPWPPISSTLIYGSRDAVVVDSFITEEQARAQADWRAASGLRTLFNELASASSDNTMLVPWEIWGDNFIQDASESVARSYWEQLSPEPNQVNWDKLGLKRFYSLTISKSFIHCRHDKALPPGYFHPRMSSRLGAFKLVEMDGSHEVMFTRPKELADKIVEASFD